MNSAADFAFKQAFALGPFSTEVVFRYVNFLLSENRVDDAVLVAETSAKMPELQSPDGDQTRNLVSQLKNFQKQAKGK